MTIPSAAAIAVDNVQFNYPDGRAALRGVSFQVAEGETVGLIGSNGAGKSTLLMHLNGILPEQPSVQSRIAIFGKPITAKNLFEIRRDVGLLFQDPDDQLFCPTVFDDVAFGPQQFGLSDDEVRACVLQALATVGLEGYQDRLPHHLSSGEKQRVCLAGILACRPRILALDEPTRALDPRRRRTLKTLLQSLTATMLIATHDLELVVEVCGRVILLDQGLVVADGRPTDILSNEELMLRHGLERPHILRHVHPH